MGYKASIKEVPLSNFLEEKLAINNWLTDFKMQSKKAKVVAEKPMKNTVQRNHNLLWNYAIPKNLASKCDPDVSFLNYMRKNT